MKQTTGKKRRKKQKKVRYHHPDLLKFSPRQIKYRQNRLAGMNIFAAATAAGYKYSYARSHATTRLERTVKVSIIDELEMAGSTNKRQAGELTRIAFEAMETEKCEVYREDDDGNITVDDAKTLREDNHARLKALDQIAKLKRQIAPSSILDGALNSDYTRVTIILEKEPNEGKKDPADAQAKSRVSLTDE